MSHLSLVRRLTIVLLAFIAVAGVAVHAADGNAQAQSSAVPDTNQIRVRRLQPDPGLLVPADPDARLWPRNGKGLTYGTPTETVHGYHEPDLIVVQATNGETGYAYRKDLEGPTPSSPDEALRWQAEQAGSRRVVRVYEQDGVTRLGEFVACEGK